MPQAFEVAVGWWQTPSHAAAVAVGRCSANNSPDPLKVTAGAFQILHSARGLSKARPKKVEPARQSVAEGQTVGHRQIALAYDQNDINDARLLDDLVLAKTMIRGRAAHDQRLRGFPASSAARPTVIFVAQPAV